MQILDDASMREADRITIEEHGIPSLSLMERAGAAVAAEAARRLPGPGSIAIVCGKGGNGGDGLVAARHLSGKGYDVEAWVLAEADALSSDAAANLASALAAGVPVRHVAPDALGAAGMGGARLCIDALFGTGLARPLAVPWDRAVAAINGCGAPVLAVDIPSGLSGSSGDVQGPAVRATVTVALQVPKWPHVLAPALELCGEVLVAEIGIAAAAVAKVGGAASVISAADAVAAFPPRPADSHKGTFGRLLVVAGSRSMPGAASLAVAGALQGGAGLVTLASVPGACQVAITRHPDALLLPLPEAADGGADAAAVDAVVAAASAANAVVVGPGLTPGPGPAAILRGLLAGTVPLVLDADALNIVAENGLQDALRERRAATILTPHPGEARRLLAGGVPPSRVEAARVLARQSGAIAVLKGHRTVVAQPGGTVALCLTGTPALARGGTGDVLAGLLGSILARNVAPSGNSAWDAARAAVYLHGLAGEILARERDEHMAPAGVLADVLPRALAAARGRAGRHGETVALAEL